MRDTSAFCNKSVVNRDQLRELQMQLAEDRAANRGEGEQAAKAALVRDRMTAAGVPAAYRDVAPDGSCLKRLEDGFGYWIAGTDNGTGKTTRAARMVRTWIERGHVSASFVRCAGIKAIETGDRLGDEARWIGAGLLVLDDLGKEPRSEWVAARILDVVDARVSAGKPIIVTSNLSIAGWRDALAAGGKVRPDTASALYSRLNGACEAVHIEGADMREGAWQGAR